MPVVMGQVMPAEQLPGEGAAAEKVQESLADRMRREQAERRAVSQTKVAPEPTVVTAQPVAVDAEQSVAKEKTLSDKIKELDGESRAAAPSSPPRVRHAYRRPNDE